MLLLLNGFMAQFAGAGISSAIVQFRELSNREIRALFWPLFGHWVDAGTRLLHAIARWIAAFFDSSEIQAVIPVIALALVATAVLQVVDGVL